MNRTIETASGTVNATVKDGTLTIEGPSGTHRVMVDERTDVEAHVEGFVAANGGEATTTGLTIEKMRTLFCFHEFELELKDTGRHIKVAAHGAEFLVLKTNGFVVRKNAMIDENTKHAWVFGILQGISMMMRLEQERW
tara:strand:+ start:1167 stop:1580 length:414 start_codon:yes stop_codon:yes gene_type:complete